MSTYEVLSRKIEAQELKIVSLEMEINKINHLNNSIVSHCEKVTALLVKHGLN